MNVQTRAVGKLVVVYALQRKLLGRMQSDLSQSLPHKGCATASFPNVAGKTWTLGARRHRHIDRRSCAKHKNVDRERLFCHLRDLLRFRPRRHVDSAADHQRGNADFQPQARSCTDKEQRVSKSHAATGHPLRQSRPRPILAPVLTQVRSVDDPASMPPAGARTSRRTMPPGSGRSSSA